MKILFLTQGESIPSSRFRVGQFIPHFRSAGHEVSVRAAYDERYNEIVQRRAPIPAIYKLLRRGLRASKMIDVRRFDIVFVQRPTFPFTALPEIALGHAHNSVIFDVDDAIFAGVDGAIDQRRDQTFREAAGSANLVIAGNEFLKSRLDEHADVRVIPTVIDTEKYRPGSKMHDDAGFVLGWMGTAGNFAFLEDIVPDITRFLESHPSAEFRMVSNTTFRPFENHAQVNQIAWSAEREIPLLQSFDVGLMPLRDTLHARGKCAFKMIQYMAVGVPYVASPVGANVEAHGNGGAGFLAAEGEWLSSMQALAADAELRASMGRRGRARAVDTYSVGAVLPAYLKAFEDVVRRS